MKRQQHIEKQVNYIYENNNYVTTKQQSSSTHTKVAIGTAHVANVYVCVFASAQLTTYMYVCMYVDNAALFVTYEAITCAQLPFLRCASPFVCSLRVGRALVWNASQSDATALA